jgi:hypothetical protein
MAMRDPGRPGRNPFFEQPDAPPPGDGGQRGGPDPASATTPPDLSALAAVAMALQQAGPEAGAHLVTAAHELVLAVKVIVDATESVLADQRAAFEAKAATDEAPVADQPDAGPRLRSVDTA